MKKALFQNLFVKEEGGEAIFGDFSAALQPRLHFVFIKVNEISSAASIPSMVSMKIENNAFSK